MTYYMIRHKATGEFMPQLKGKGYSHWNPDSCNNHISNRKLTGTPRILASIGVAKRVIAQWNCLPNAYNHFRQGYDGDSDLVIDVKEDGRKKEDLEIVIVNIEETGVIT